METYPGSAMNPRVLFRPSLCLLTVLASLPSGPMAQAQALALAQVRSGTLDLNGSGTASPDSALEAALGQGAEVVGAVASHEGTGKAMEELSERFRNLSRGLSPDGRAMNRSEIRSMFEGSGKSAQVKAFQEKCQSLSDRLEALGKAIAICDIGAKFAGHIAEGDVSGALIVIPQECGKQISAKVGAALMSWAGPLGMAGGSAAGEELWKRAGGEGYFEHIAQQVAYLEKVTEFAGAKIRNPDILAYMKGEISQTELKKRLVAFQQEALQRSIARWQAYASDYPGLRQDIEALLSWNADGKQRMRLFYFRELVKRVGDDAQLKDALRAWTEGRATSAQKEALLRLLLDRLDGTYQGRVSGGGAGSLTLTIKSGVVEGQVSGSSAGDGFRARLKGSISPAGFISAHLSGTLVDSASTTGDAYGFQGTFSGTLHGNQANGTWTAHNEYGDQKGSWNASR